MKKLSKDRDYYLVETSEDIETLLKNLLTVDLVSFDTETTGVNTRQDRIIGYSFSYAHGNGFYVPVYSYVDNELKPHKIVGTKKLLETLASKKLVMHNASFDTRIVMSNYGIDMLASLHADTMLMRHTLNEEGPFGLKDIAVEKSQEIGMSRLEVANQEQQDLEQNVISKGGAWKKTDKHIYKADLDILAKYACADTDLTLRLYQVFNKELKEQNLTEFFYSQEVMPLYQDVTIPMEFKGVHLDMPKLQVLIEEITKDITSLEEKVTKDLLSSEAGQKFIEFRCEEEVEIKPSGNFAQGVAEYYNLDLPKNANGKYSMTAKNLKSLVDSPAKAFLLNYVEGEYEEVTSEVLKDIQLNILKKDGPLININSKQQLGKIVFDIMGVKPLSTTDKGAPQFNEDFIEHLAKDNIVSWASDLRVYNKLVKIFGSSYERFMTEQEEGVFYPYFKQHGTTSGRYSSNLQQLPRPLEAGSDHPLIEKYTNEIRALFIPKPGHIFIDDDYASLEPSVFAHDAEDQPLLDIFIKGEDFYSKVAIMALGLNEASADKKAPNFLKNTHPQERQDAKAYSLGLRYGASEGKVAELLNIDKDAAKVISDNYFKAFPKLKGKMDAYMKQAKTTGMVRSEFGRVRHLDEVKSIHRKFGDDILDYSKLRDLSKKHYVSYNDLMDIRKRYKNLLNNALNFPIQSAATTVISRAAVKVIQTFRERGIDGHIVTILHDQIIASVDETRKDEAMQIVQDCMENTTKLRVPLFAIPQTAYNMRDGH